MYETITHQKLSPPLAEVDGTQATIIDYNKKSRKILKQVMYKLREIAEKNAPKSTLLRELSVIEDELIKAMISIGIAETTTHPSGKKIKPSRRK